MITFVIGILYLKIKAVYKMTNILRNVYEDNKRSKMFDTSLSLVYTQWYLELKDGILPEKHFECDNTIYTNFLSKIRSNVADDRVRCMNSQNTKVTKLLLFSIVSHSRNIKRNRS